MTATSEDLAYATYMLNWVDKLDWPDLPIADEALPALRAYWMESVDTDLDAISERLWAWVDANGGPQPSTDKSMILVRMLICLAAVPNRELEQVGYFEQLLRNYGVASAEVAHTAPRKPFEGSLATGADNTPGVAAPVSGAHQQAKAQILWAFAAVSFIAGANPVVAMSADMVRMIELGLVFAMVFLIFLWYRIDADERGFQRSLLLNVAIVMVAALAVPYYLIRSRGWQEGQLAVLKALVVFVGSIVLSALGAMLFGHVPA
jgi:hypothetical protein